MEMVFITAAAVGGTVLVGQFILGVLGLGGHGFDHGGDAGHDVAGHDTDMQDSWDDASASHDAHDSSWFFGVVSFRTLVAAVTFFGLTGMVATSAQLDEPLPLLIALASGGAAMYGVYYVMQMLSRLQSDGTERISRAVGSEGTVYLSIPGQHQGVGKIHITLQNRSVEVAAKTAGDRLPTGTRIIIVAASGPDFVEVELAPQTSRSQHA